MFELHFEYTVYYVFGIWLLSAVVYHQFTKRMIYLIVFLIKLMTFIFVGTLHSCTCQFFISITKLSRILFRVWCKQNWVVFQGILH